MPCRRDDLLQQAFAQFDDDSDGFITEDKLARVTNSKGFHVDAADVKRMIAENDSNGDGKIDYEEVRVRWAVKVAHHAPAARKAGPYTTVMSSSPAAGFRGAALVCTGCKHSNQSV